MKIIKSFLTKALGTLDRLAQHIRLEILREDIHPYTGCPRRNVKYFGRVFLMLNYTDITQNTYIQS